MLPMPVTRTHQTGKLWLTAGEAAIRIRPGLVSAPLTVVTLACRSGVTASRLRRLRNDVALPVTLLFR
jgi:hypothetical protein